MEYNHSNKRNSTVTTVVMCAIVFSIFSFSWLYWFQADVLAVAQHVFSGGQTQYHSLLTAVVITLVLLLIQRHILFIVRLYRRAHWLTYFPLMLFLALASDVSDRFIRTATAGWWILWVILALCIWGVGVWLSKQLNPFPSPKESLGIFSKCGILNVLGMTLMMLMVAGLANTNAVFHFRTHVETALIDGNLDEVLRTGQRSHETDTHLTMLRAYALSKKGELGERLFEYPVAGRGCDLIPMATSDSRLLRYPADSLYRHLGANAGEKMTTYRYYDLLEYYGWASKAVADYRLCGLLMDRNIDEFVRQLPRYYTINDSLPKHYKEALVLYTHQRYKPAVVYHHAVLDEDWSDFCALTKQYARKNERKYHVEEHYRTSYWYYYFKES